MKQKNNFPKCTKLIWMKVILLLIFIFSCKENKLADDTEINKVANTAIVIFTIGDVTANGNRLKQGDIVSSGEIVKTGKKSSCEMQFREHSSEIVIQLKQNSEFNIEKNSIVGEVKSNILLGNILYKVNKPLKKGESVRVVTPTFVAGVRGTEFSLEVAKNGDSNVSVVSGKVSAIHRISALDDLPDDVIKKSKFLQESLSNLEKNETIIEQGEKVVVTKKESDQILSSSKLNDLILIAKESASKSTSDEIALRIDENAKKNYDNKLATEILPPTLKKMAEKDFQKQYKEFENLIALEQSKLLNSELTKAELKKINEEHKEVMIQKIEQIMGKTSETLILRSGIKIKGVVFQEGKKIIVLTPEGRKEYLEEEVEGMEF